MKKRKTRTNTKSQLKIAGMITLILVFLAWGLSALKSEVKKEAISTAPTTDQKDDARSLELAMVGDMLPHETLAKAASKGDSYDYLSLISPDLKATFQKADLRFCNQEAVSAANLPVRGYPAFNAPVQFAKDINSFGCNIISTANNHAADQGLAGIEGTLEAWDEIKPLAISGTHRTVEEAEKLSIVEKNGIKVGFTAFNEVNNVTPPASEVGVNMLADYKLLDQQIKSLRAQSDVVVVSIHWGAEDSHTLTSAQKEYAKKIANLGADVIIGTGPHVWQSYQILDRADGGKTHLWYSIGNGINTQTKPDQLFSAIALLKITKDQSGKVSIESPRVLPTYVHYTWGNGIGLSQAQLLGRREIEWRLLTGSQQLIDARNDFKTTELEQINKLKAYLNNEQVKILNSY